MQSSLADLNAPNVCSEILGNQYLPGPMYGPYSFINISCGREEELDDASCSRKNMVEVAVGIKIVSKLYKAWKIHGSKEKLRVGLGSFYAAQVHAFKEKLGHKYENVGGFTLTARSINDGFEDEEVDVVILSTVKSNKDESIGSISNHLTTNLADLPKASLWIIGNGSVWESLVQDARERNCFFNAEEDEDLAKLLVEVKKEIEEFDNLLSADSELFKNTLWKVFFSDDFRKSFGDLKSYKTKKLVINLLHRLSCGWRPKKRNVNLTGSRFPRILKQFKMKDLYVICSVDVKKESVHYIQVLKVWDILPMEKIPKLVARLDAIFTMYNDDFLNNCKIKCINGDLEVPMSWDTSKEIVPFKDQRKRQNGNSSCVDALEGRNYLEKSRVNESLSLMKFYSLSSGMANHLLSGCDGKELGLAYELTDKELEITNFSRSSFVLGRSGTGKTTVLIMKLFQREQLYHLASEGFHEVNQDPSSTDVRLTKEDNESVKETTGAFLRQLFVTVSPKLCYAVQQNIYRLQRFTCGGNSTSQSSYVDMRDIDEVSQFRDIPDSFVNLPSTSYPLIITFHKFLMMFDGTIGRSYFERFPEVRRLSSQGQNRGSRSVAFQAFIRDKEVNYDKFHSSYWPHFNSQLIKHFDSSIVFTEIISRIKGGVGSSRAFDCEISLEEYLSISKGQVSSLSTTERERIYEIFLKYQTMKMERGEFDFGDLVIDLHRRCQDEKYDGSKIDFVYVDEVQDLTMRQIALLKYICRNFEGGFVFSGDTAQTIARGIDFRFQDIRALFYEDFRADSKSFATNGKGKKGQISDIFQLSQNFRTHCGVLKLSQSILDLLYHFFPLTIDVLSPETSLVDGEAPVLLELMDKETKLRSMFLNRSSSGQVMDGFGADQVILVRDECVKAEVLSYVGNQALVLTIFECKGLEFQDVLLYNFFSSSPLENQWRVIYDYLDKLNLLDSTSMSFPRFNDGKDIILCSELKQLYVAITRTRQRLWILETVEDVTGPMFHYWKKLCLIQVRSLDHSFMEEIQVLSSKEEWKSRGIKLFHQRNYDMAQMCFEKAGDTYWKKLAEASGLQAAANRLSDSNRYMAHTYLKIAAELFDSLGKYELAAQCYINLKDYETAGKIYLEKFGESRLEEAGECFALAKCYKSAADAYNKANLLSKCLAVCDKGKLFNLGMQYIQNWRRHYYLGRKIVEIEKTVQDFWESAARHFNTLEDYKTMMKFVEAFHSKDSMRTFLKGLGHLDQLLSLEQAWGDFENAANVAKLKGEVLLEVDQLEMAGKFEDASVLILNYILCNSLWEHGSNGWPMKKFPVKNDLLTKSKEFAKKVSDKFYQLVDAEAKVLSDECYSLLEMKQHLIKSQRHRSATGEILCARRILDTHFDLSASQYNWEDNSALNLTDLAFKRLSKNQVTVETLFYFWGLWKEEIENLLQSLEDPKEQDVYTEFCLRYFGVRKELINMNQRFILMNPDSHWTRVISKRFFKREWNLVTIDEKCFVRAAQSYWSSELLSVGIKVVENLEALNVFSSGSSLPNHSKIKTLAYTFGVTKSLISFLNLSCEHISMLQKLNGYIINVFVSLFVMDCGKLVTKNAILFRKTQVFMNLLEEVIHRNVKSNYQLTYGEIGTVVTILLGCNKLADKVCEKIEASFTFFPPWKAWIQTFRANNEWKYPQMSAPESSSTDLPIEVSLVYKFHQALEESYHGDWRAKFMAPACFLYLVERLLTMISYLNGHFFTTRTLFVEWFICQEWKPRRSSSHEADNAQYSFRGPIDFLVLVVQQVLFHEKDTKQWIEESSTNVEYVYRQLVLRLIVLMCLLCVNTRSETHWDLLFYLLTREDITKHLPRDFYETLRRLKRDRVEMSTGILAEASRKIGDPLVIVNERRRRSRFSHIYAIFVDLEEMPSREYVLRRLFW